MIIVLLFLLILGVTFAVVVYLTKPSEQERRLQERLGNIEVVGVVDPQEPADLLKRVTYSDIPFLDDLFRRYALTRTLKSLIDQADSDWTVGRLVAATLLIFFGVALLSAFWIPSIILRLIIATLLATIPYVWIRIKRQSRFRRFSAAIPEAIDLMSRALRAGHSISSAIEMVGQEISDPVGPEFRKVFEQQNFGLPFRESMEDLARRVPVPDLRFLVTAILVQKETGGNLAEVFDKAAAVIRERLRLQGELRVYTAQGRLTGWILGLLPFIMFVLLSLINHQYTRVLIEDPLGQNLIIAGIVLMAAGFFIIRRIVDIKV